MSQGARSNAVVVVALMVGGLLVRKTARTSSLAHVCVCTLVGRGGVLISISRPLWGVSVKVLQKVNKDAIHPIGSSSSVCGFY